MEIEFNIFQYILIFFGVALAGLIDSIAGGGGLITIPLYIAVGVPENLILGTNKTVSTIGGTISIFRYIKNKAIVVREGILGGVFSIIGAIIGAQTSNYLSSKYMVYILIVVLPAILIINKNIDFNRKNIETKLDIKTVIFRTALIGLTLGFYDGFFGPGYRYILINMPILIFKLQCTSSKCHC